MEQQLADLAAAMAAIQKQNTAIQTSVGSLEEIKPMVVELAGWKPTVERTVAELQDEMAELRTQVEQISRSPARVTKLADLPPLLPTPPGPKLNEIKDEEPKPSPELKLPQVDEHAGLFSHRAATSNRGKTLGNENFPSSLPGKGTFYSSPGNNSRFEFGESSGRFGSSHHVHHHGGSVRVDCPSFDGDNPRAWKLKCETYFRVSGVYFDHWVGVAALQFMGAALTWLQSTDAHIECVCWEDFAEAVCKKFGREEFQGLIRQFNQLRQTGTVTSYAERFSELIHQLQAHHSSWNPVFFVTQFMDGLRADIRAAVVLHRPQDLDTAVDLACLQEEVLEVLRKEMRRNDFAGGVRTVARPNSLTSVSTVRQNTSLGNKPDEWRITEESRASMAEDKLSALRAYCRAKGLCYTCGERYNRDRKCGPTVQLHVVEELLEMLSAPSVDNSGDEQSSVQDPTEGISEGEICQISKEAMMGIEASGTLRLQGFIQKHEVLMLVDSGSSRIALYLKVWLINCKGAGLLFLLSRCAWPMAEFCTVLKKLLIVNGGCKDTLFVQISRFCLWVVMTLYWVWIGL